MINICIIYIPIENLVITELSAIPLLQSQISIVKLLKPHNKIYVSNSKDIESIIMNRVIPSYLTVTRE